MVTDLGLSYNACIYFLFPSRNRVLSAAGCRHARRKIIPDFAQLYDRAQKEAADPGDRAESRGQAPALGLCLRHTTEMCISCREVSRVVPVEQYMAATTTTVVVVAILLLLLCTKIIIVAFSLSRLQGHVT